MYIINDPQLISKDCFALLKYEEKKMQTMTHENFIKENHVNQEGSDPLNF